MIPETFGTPSLWIRQIDPRCRILSATLFAFTLALADHFHTLLAGSVISILILCLSGLNVCAIFKRVALVNTLILFLWLIIPLTYKGGPIYPIGPLVLHKPGILLCAAITLKSNSILIIFITLVATMPITTLGEGLLRLHLPDKLVNLLLMTYRYIFVIEQEYCRLIRALKTRGFRPKTHLHTYKTYAYLIGMLFIRALARAERVHLSMRCRGFKGRFYSLQQFSFGMTDWLWLTVTTILIAGLIVFDTFPRITASPIM